MAQPTASDRSRPRVDQRSAHAGAPRQRGRAGARRALPGTDRRHRRRHGGGRHAAGRGARPARPRGDRLTASSPTRSRRTCSSSEKIYNFIRPMKTVGVVQPARGPEGHRDRRAVRRRRRDRPLDQPDLDRHLQDPDLDQGALPDRHQPASVGGPLHHAGRRDHERRRAHCRARPTARSTG